MMARYNPDPCQHCRVNTPGYPGWQSICAACFPTTDRAGFEAWRQELLAEEDWRRAEMGEDMPFDLAEEEASNGRV